MKGVHHASRPRRTASEVILWNVPHGNVVRTVDRPIWASATTVKLRHQRPPPLQPAAVPLLPANDHALAAPPQLQSSHQLGKGGIVVLVAVKGCRLSAQFEGPLEPVSIRRSERCRKSSALRGKRRAGAGLQFPDPACGKVRVAAPLHGAVAVPFMLTS